MAQQPLTSYIIKGRQEAFSPMALCGAFPGSSYFESQAYSICLSGAKVPVANAIWQHQIEKFDQDELHTILNRFQQAQVPFFWWEAPVQQDSPLLNSHPILNQQSLQPGGFLKGVCMSFDAGFSSTAPSSIVEIRQVHAKEDLALFCQVVFSCFGFSPAQSKQMQQLIDSVTEAGHLQHYLAYQDSLPIGGITLSIGETTAGLWNFAVQENYRKKGVGSALIHRALLHTKKLGYQHVMAILSSEETGLLWRQFDFQDACLFPYYVGNLGLSA